MKDKQTFLIISIACSLVIFGLTMFFMLQFSFMVGIIFGVSAFLALAIAMLIYNRKKRK